jgi:hypothetical protein
MKYLKFVIPLLFASVAVACGDCDCVIIKKTVKTSPNEHDHHSNPVLTPTPVYKQEPVKKSPVQQNPTQNPWQSPVQDPRQQEQGGTRYKCRCSGFESICTAEELKDSSLGCYIVW